MTIADPLVSSRSSIRIGDRDKSLYLGDVADEINDLVDSLEEVIEKEVDIKGLSPYAVKVINEILDSKKSQLLTAVSNFEQDIAARAA